MSADANRELVRHWIEDGWNGRNTEAVLSDVFASDWIDGDAASGPHGFDGVRAFVATYSAAFPDISITVLQVVADEDFVAFRWRAEATHTGELYGRQPTGKSVSVIGHTMHRVVAGRFQESWVQVDTMGLLAQLD